MNAPVKNNQQAVVDRTSRHSPRNDALDRSGAKNRFSLASTLRQLEVTYEDGEETTQTTVNIDVPICYRATDIE